MRSNRLPRAADLVGTQPAAAADHDATFATMKAMGVFAGGTRLGLV